MNFQKGDLIKARGGRWRSRYQNNQPAGSLGMIIDITPGLTPDNPKVEIDLLDIYWIKAEQKGFAYADEVEAVKKEK